MATQVSGAGDSPPDTVYDLLFLVDATHSMHHFIDGLNQSLPDSLRIAALAGSFERIGVLAYRDYVCKDVLMWSGWCCPSGKITDGVVDQSIVVKKAASITTQANNDTEEAVKTGLAYAYQVMRPEVTTLIVLYTDAPPHLKQVKDQNYDAEQAALQDPSSYGGTGHLFADWTSAAKALTYGPKKATVFAVLRSGSVSATSPYQYLCEMTGGLMLQVERPTADVISQVITTWILTWLGIDRSKINTAEGRSIRIDVSSYANTKKIELATREDEEKLRRFMVTQQSKIFFNNNKVTSITLNDLGDVMKARGPPLGNLSERYEVDDDYKNLVVDQLRDIFRENVSAVALNPVFGSLWRAVCTGRGGADRDVLAPIFGHHVNQIVNFAERDRMRTWLENSYDYSDAIHTEISNVATSDLYPLVFLDPTADFEAHDEDENDDIRVTTPLTRGDLLEIGRSCDGRVLRRLGEILTRITIVNQVEDVPSHILTRSGDLRVSYVPLAMTTERYKRRFWKVLLHTIIPGTMLASRAAAVLAALALRTGITALRDAADAELLHFGPRWNDIDTPENWSPGCMNLILHADRDYEERAGTHRDPSACILREEDRRIFRLLLDYKLLEAHLHTPFSAVVSWSPHKTQVPIGPVVKCTVCSFPRSVTVMAANSICGLCCKPAHPRDCDACTLPSDRQDRICANVSTSDDESTSAAWVECAMADCRAQYVIYNPKTLSIRPKCFYCRHTGRMGKAPTVECTQCLSRVLFPHEYRPTGIEHVFKCTGCASGKRTTVEEETSAQKLKPENGWHWLLRNDDAAIKYPFSGRSLHNIALNADLDTIASKVDVLPDTNEVVVLRGKRVQNMSAIQGNMREWLAGRIAAIGGSCTLCFRDIKHTELNAACGRSGCNQQICSRCSRAWYGMNRPGRLINIAALNCPFCRRLPTRKVGRRYKLADVGDLSVAVTQAGEWIYGWCERCNHARAYMARRCADGAPDPVRRWRCEPCQPPPKLLKAKPRDVSQAIECPRCGVMTERTSGCSHMTCPCGQDWCYICGRGFYSAGDTYEHIDAVHGGLGWR